MEKHGNTRCRLGSFLVRLPKQAIEKDQIPWLVIEGAHFPCLLLLIAAAKFLFVDTKLLAKPTAKPDVLFIVVDDMNDWISLLDPKAPIKTPNLERLARRGMLFTRAYCVSAACNPSRAATLTGLRPSTTGVYGNKSNWRRAVGKRKTIMQRFMEADYEVRGAGKIFHHHLNGAFHDLSLIHI